ncbi:hypothetical protein TNCV_2119331 [Trichonephila clavipes]|nr:hypothetical protein TNCV_2119331 [Trichonephila clavipes]
MFRGRHRASFNQFSEFDQERIVAYSNCGLSFIEIGQLVRRNQAAVMWISHRWMQEKTKDLQGRSHSPRCIPGSIFQQDNARLHITKIVRDFCSAQHMQLLPWPS